ncbi:hypothetical protein CRENBAI_026097, partial [Crenichthys baileyi]
MLRGVAPDDSSVAVPDQTHGQMLDCHALETLQSSVICSVARQDTYNNPNDMYTQNIVSHGFPAVTLPFPPPTQTAGLRAFYSLDSAPQEARRGTGLMDTRSEGRFFNSTQYCICLIHKMDQKLRVVAR